MSSVGSPRRLQIYCGPNIFDFCDKFQPLLQKIKNLSYQSSFWLWLLSELDSLAYLKKITNTRGRKNNLTILINLNRCHQLLCKLTIHGVDIKMFNWLKSCLKDKTQKVRVDRWLYDPFEACLQTLKASMQICFTIFLDVLSQF